MAASLINKLEDGRIIKFADATFYERAMGSGLIQRLPMMMVTMRHAEAEEK